MSGRGENADIYLNYEKYNQTSYFAFRLIIQGNSSQRIKLYLVCTYHPKTPVSWIDISFGLIVVVEINASDLSKRSDLNVYETGIVLQHVFSGNGGREMRIFICNFHF